MHLLSWHQIQEDEGLLEALKHVKEARLLPEEQVRLCVLADGARWIGKRIKTLFPNAKEVLDYYPCSKHIHGIAQAQYGDHPEKALEWVEATMARLFCGEGDGVIWGLQVGVWIASSAVGGLPRQPRFPSPLLKQFWPLGLLVTHESSIIFPHLDRNFI
ncbi:MAG: hypothetical protein ACK4Z6_03295 [Candidatus Methylomirabilales bacterium]